MSASTVSLRPADPSDAPFFYRVIAETMRDHVIATWGSWTEERVRAESVEDASSPNAHVIVVDGNVGGVMTVERHSDHIQLEQLYLLPQYQRRGIGTSLVRSLTAEASVVGVPLRLRVLAVNPARVFYETLGFVATEITHERIFMERAP